MANVHWEVESSKSVGFTRARDFAIKSCNSFAKHVDQNNFKRVFDSINSLVVALESPIRGCKSNFHILTVNGYAQVPISFSEDINAGIYNYLSTFLIKYIPDFNGIWISFRKVKKLDSLARLNHNAEILSFSISVRALVYIPQLGIKAYGQVSLVSMSRITVLCYGMFNTIVSDIKQKCYINKGDIVSFNIQKISPQNDFVTLFATKLKVCKSPSPQSDYNQLWVRPWLH